MKEGDKRFGWDDTLKRNSRVREIEIGPQSKRCEMLAGRAAYGEDRDGGPEIGAEIGVVPGVKLGIHRYRFEIVKGL